MEKPPPLPAEVLARVLRVAAIDGFTLVFIAGGFGLISVFCADWLGSAVGGLAAGAGLIELRGRRHLRAGEANGMTELVRSQLFLLTIILFYVVYQLLRFDPAPFLASIDSALASVQRSFGMEVVSLETSLELTHEQFLVLARRLVCVTYVAVGVASLLCQGGLAFYYHRRKQTVAKALRKF